MVNAYLIFTSIIYLWAAIPTWPSNIDTMKLTLLLNIDGLLKRS